MRDTGAIPIEEDGRLIIELARIGLSRNR